MSDVRSLVSLKVGELKIDVFNDRRALGEAAAAHAARRLKDLVAQHQEVAVIFATGASQMETLRALTSRTDVPWAQITGYHMDEYVGLSDQHPASFRRYMRERLTGPAPLKCFYPVVGDAPDPERTCSEYAEMLRRSKPQLCLLGIGENGHLAFNDPAEADFDDPAEVKVVSLDVACRQQQVNEGWFQSLTEVPGQAITLTIPTLMRVPELIASVPGERKALIVKRTLEEAISTNCPATILRKHPRAALYLDRESAAELNLAF